LAALLLLTAAWALAVLSLADLVFAIAEGVTLIVGPALGLALGWFAGRNGASRRSSHLAIWANVAVLAVTAVAIVLYAGS
jgi:hypothetical protein